MKYDITRRNMLAYFCLPKW